MNIREPHQYQKLKNQRRLHHGLKRLKRWVVLLFTVCVCLVLLGYVSYVQAISLGKPQTQLPDLQAQQVALNWPKAGQAAIGVLGLGVMAETPNAQPTPTASVAKLMIALAVLKKYPIEPGQMGTTFTVSQTDVDSYNEYLAEGGSVIPVQLGEQINEYQALQALLLPSANNFAFSLARWSYGSLEAYVDVANQMTQDLGMVNSHFADASGFAPETVSTPHDLVLLGQAAMRNPIIKQIVSQPSASNIPQVGTIYNTNGLLGYQGVVGIKTGNTDQAGGCYLVAASHQLSDGQTITVIGAIMGSPTLTQAMLATPPLLQSFFQGFGKQTVINKGQVLGSYRLPWGGSAKVVAANDLSVFGWQGQAAELTAQMKRLTADANSKDPVGTVTAKSPFGQAVGQLVLEKPINPPSLGWRVFRR